MFGYDKNRNKFGVCKQGQYLLVEDMLNEICPKSNDTSFDKIGDTFYYEISIKFEKLNDPLVIGKTNLESKKTENNGVRSTSHLQK
jgi:hypothetical protein